MMSSDLTVTLHRSIAEIGATDWDRLAGDAFYVSYAWLRQFEGEERLYEGLEPTYVRVAQGENVVGLAPCFTGAKPGSLPFGNNPHRRYLAGGGGPPPFSEESLYPVTLCDAPVGFSNRLLVRHDLAPADRQAVVSRLVEEVMAVARERAANFVAFGFLPVHDAEQICTARPELVPIFCHAEAILAVEGGFEGYLARFSHSRRRNVRVEVRRFEAEGLRFLRPSFADALPQFVPLFVAHEKEYGNVYDPAFVAKTLGRVEKAFANRWRVIAAMRGDEMVAASVSVLHDGVYYGRFWGVDRARAPKKAALYFNCNYYEPIRAAAEEGVHTLHFGAGTVDAKVAHGCDPRSLWTVVGFTRPPDPKLVGRLRERSETRLQELVASLRAIGRQDPWIDEALQLPAGRALLASR